MIEVSGDESPEHLGRLIEEREMREVCQDRACGGNKIDWFYRKLVIKLNSLLTFSLGERQKK